MATYSELRSLFDESQFRGRIEVAVIVAAETVRVEAVETVNHANRLIWAKATFRNPASAAAEMVKALLAANKSASLAAIQGASDGVMQTQVDAAVNVFADGS